MLAARTPRIQRRARALRRPTRARCPNFAIARTATIDNAVRRAATEGAAQLVILGAVRHARAAHAGAEPRARVRSRSASDAGTQLSLLAASRSVYVPVDFLNDDTFARLASHGWNRAVPTLFIWEGVTNYLDEAAVLRVLREVGSCAAGSSIVFTYVHRGIIDDSVAFEGADILRNVRGMSEPWTFGILPEELEGFVARVGLKLREDLGADQYRARYLPAWENMNGYAFYRVAVAEVG